MTQPPGLAGETLPYREAPPIAPGDPKIVRTMADMLADRDPASDAEALRVLRGAYPDLPLTLRLAALAMQTRRLHIPR